jgi:uncharacterized protein (DUF2235 family)
MKLLRAGAPVKRIVILIDGTWDKEGTTGNTNVAKLDVNALIKRRAADGTVQRVRYHDGVGAYGDIFKKVLGGAIGLGLKKIVLDCYGFLVDDYEAGDEIYILGFSRGAYAARALAGLIGASGIARRPSADLFEIAWQHYRVSPASRQQPRSANWADRSTIAKYRSTAQGKTFHDTRSIKCVGVWDTVGSYGIPAGFGLASLARYIALIFLGFHDTSFGEHVDVGLHAVAVDEHRRPFVPTLWTIAKGQHPRGHVEQTWFAGAHRNVGGGYPDSGISDLALIWMIARVRALTGLEFDMASVKSNAKPNIGGAVVDSTKGWFLDEHWPHYRAILSPMAIHHGYIFNSAAPDEENINERVHWSALAKRGSGATPLYNPPNLPTQIPPEKIAAITDEEQDLLPTEKRFDVPSAHSDE